MSWPKVTVVIPSYNYGKYIQEAVDSVLAQSYPNVELIVVDDGSQDDTLDILKKYGDRVSVIAQKNKGVSAARNAGAESSTGDYVAFLDADDIWLKDKLENQMCRFFEDDEAGLVHCAMRFIDRTGKLTGGERTGKGGWLANDILLLKEAVVGAGSTAVVKRDLFERINGFDHRLSTAADWDFCYRAAQEAKIGYVPEALVLYRIHGSNMHSNLDAMEHDVRLGFAKAFSDSSARTQKIRSDCYGNFYWLMSGSHFRAKNYTSAIMNGAKCIYYDPGKVGKLFMTPFRHLFRRYETKAS